MDFDEWMAGVAPTYSPTDDSVTLRILRRCWIEAQAAERERCAKLCEERGFGIIEQGAIAWVAAAIRGN